MMLGTSDRTVAWDDFMTCLRLVAKGDHRSVFRDSAARPVTVMLLEACVWMTDGRTM